MGPFDEGKSLRLVVIGIARVSTARERIRFDWPSSCCFLSLNRSRVIPLYTQVDAYRFTESRGRIIEVSGSISIPLTYNTSLLDKVGLHLQALIRLWALGLLKAPISCHLHGLQSSWS